MVSNKRLEASLGLIFFYGLIKTNTVLRFPQNATPVSYLLQLLGYKRIYRFLAHIERFLLSTTFFFSILLSTE